MTADATADLEAYRFVGVSGGYAGADGVVHGVLLNDISVGKRGAVGRFGRCRIPAGGAIAVGDKIVSDADGLPVAAGADPANVIATALSATTAAGQFVDLFVS